MISALVEGRAIFHIPWPYEVTASLSQLIMLCSQDVMYTKGQTIIKHT